MTTTTKPTHAPRRAALLLLLPALGACGAAGGTPTPEDAARAAAMTITAEDVGQKVDVLADDSMAGRNTPSPGLESAARYIAARLEAAGVEPAGRDGGYRATWEYGDTRLIPEETRLMAEGSAQPATYATDFFLAAPPRTVQAPAFYVGVAGDAPMPPAEARGKVLVYTHPSAELDEEWQMRLMAGVQPAMMSGSPGVVFIMAESFADDQMGTLAQVTAGQAAPLGVAGMTRTAGEALLAELGHDLAALEAAGTATALGATPVIMDGTRVSMTTEVPNVVGMVRGSDPELADTYVVLTAHFDHVGVGAPDESGDSINNGADDDASGTAAVLEIAEAFAALDAPPARSVVFLLVSGEEKGLLGSRAWVADATVDIESVVANVNLDMVGRNAPDTVIGIGQEYSTLQGVLNEITAQRPELGLNVILDPMPEENLFFRSDQLPFIQRGIPAVFFTTGLHDEYHQVSDEAHLIDDDKLARIARLGFYLAHAIAMDPTPPEWTEEGRARVREMLGQ